MTHFSAPLLRASLLALLATTSLAQAQEFPTKPVRIVTPFPAGSGPEVALRLVADKLGKRWGQPVIVDNRPGAGGVVAGETVARALLVLAAQERAGRHTHESDELEQLGGAR